MLIFGHGVLGVGYDNGCYLRLGMFMSVNIAIMSIISI